MSKEEQNAQEDCKPTSVGVPSRAFAQWGMDLVGPLSGAVVCYLMVLIEYLTKWPEVYCIPNKEAITVSRCLKELLERFGVPEIIISDLEREFCNELKDNFCSSLGIARHICTAYHPQSNSLTERFNQAICTCLSKYSDGGKLNWEDDLDLFLLGYRSSMRTSSLYSPFELVYGVKARLPIELDLPPHKCQADKDDNSMVKLMVNSKLLDEKHSDAHRPPKKGNTTENIAGKKSLQSETKSGMPIPDEIQERVTNYPLKGLGLFLMLKHVGKKLIGHKRRFDQLVKVKRAITGDIVPLECDGKASKINNTPCMRSYCRHELHLMVLLYPPKGPFFSEPMITARSGAVTVRASEYVQLLKGDCIGDNVYNVCLCNAVLIIK